MSQSDDGVFICQKKYTRDLLNKFGLIECNSVRNPIVPSDKPTLERDGVMVDGIQYKQLIESLLYLTPTRPDIMFVVCLLNRFMAQPTRLHMQAAKRVLRYLKGTFEYGILYMKSEDNSVLITYTDSDCAGDLNDRRSKVDMCSFSPVVLFLAVLFLAGVELVHWETRSQIGDIMTKAVKLQTFMAKLGVEGWSNKSEAPASG